MPLYAGVCETNITPPAGVWMCGYAFRPSGCTGIHDELWARAAVFSDGERTAAIASMDLIGLDFDLVARVREGVASATGIAPEAVMLNATHTHGGPNVRTFNAMGDRDEPYIDVLARKLIGAIAQAAHDMAPAQLAVGTAQAQIGINRRQGGPGGTVIGRNFAGPVDTAVRALRVSDSRGRPLAVLFTHACHGTTLGGDNLRITADWCGYACDHVRRESGGDITPMFLQGCAGNINPLDRATFAAAERNGRAIGEAAIDAVEGAVETDWTSPATVRFVERTVSLPVMAPPAREACQAAVREWEGKLAEAQRTGGVGAILNAEGMLSYARRELAMAEAGAPPAPQPFAIQCIWLNDVPIIGLPGEVFVQYGIDFAQCSSETALVLAYTNGVHGYVPTAADYALGGYEVSVANRYYGAPMVGPECEGIIRQTVYDMLGVDDAADEPYSLVHQSPLARFMATDAPEDPFGEP